MRLLKLLFTICLIPALALAECEIVEFDNNSNIIRAKILDSTDGQGLTGLSSASSGLRIAVIADNASSTTAYTVAGSTIESIATLGTYAAPTATKVRLKEVDPTNHPGIYEIQLADAIFSASGAKSLILSASGATNMVEMDCHIPLVYSQATVASNLLGTALSAPAACLTPGTSTLGETIAFLSALAQNKVACTSSNCILYANDGSTPVCTFSNSDSAGTFTSGAGS